jgi:hypothetical protein
MALPKLESAKYSLVIPSSGKKISFRPYTVKEEKAIMMAQETGKEEDMINSVKELMKVCLDDFPIEELTTFDFEYIFLKLRSKSAGETSDVLINCDNCNEQTAIKLALETAEVSGELKDKKELVVKLTDTIGVQLSYPKFTSSLRITEEGGEYNSAIKAIVTCIESIYDENGIYLAKDHTTKELVEFIEGLATIQFEKILEVFVEIPTISIKGNYICSTCNHKGEKEIQGLQNFF